MKATVVLAALFLHSAPAWAATSPVVARGPLPWQFLAHAGPGELDAALVTADLGQLDGQLHDFVGQLKGTAAGQALFGQEAAPSPLQALLQCAAPQGQPAAAAVLLVQTPAGLAARLALQVQPGFVQRCADRTLGAYQLRVRSEQEGLIDFIAQGGGESYVGRVTADNTLLIASDPGALAADGVSSVAADSAHLPTAAMRRATQPSTVALWLRGGGQLFAQIAAHTTSPVSRALVQQLSAIAVTLHTDAQQTAVLRLTLEAPWVAALGKSMGGSERAAQNDALLEHLDADALSYASLQSSPLLRASIPALLAQGLGQASLQLPDDVLNIFTQLTGRMGVVAYDAPGDWAVALQLENAAAAQDLLPVLQGFATALAKRWTPQATSAFSLETFAPLPRPVLHLRPDPAVEGPYVAALDDTRWFVQERSRLQKLAAAPEARPTLLQGPLSPLMRQVLAPGHLAQSYTVLGGDSGWVDYALWGVGRLQSTLQSVRLTAAGPVAPSPLQRAMGHSLPKILAVAQALWLRTYDAAFTADIDGSLMQLTAAASEI
jgi:hypothetical protein